VLVDKFTGLRNNTRTERFDPSDLDVADNVDLDDSFKVSRRPGYTAQYSGDVHSLWCEKELCLFVEGNELKQYHKDGTTSVLRDGLTEYAKASYVLVDGKVYFCNGHQTAVIENGIARSWGLESPGVFPAQTSIGDLDPGTYQYRMTYIRSDGQESGASPQMKIDVSGGAISFPALPVSNDSTVTHKVIYLSPANGDVLYEALTLLNNDTTALISTECLTVPLEYRNAVAAPAGHLVAYHSGRLYVADGNVIYPSNAFGYELFEPMEFMQMEDRITMLAPSSNGIFVGTECETGYISGLDPRDMVYDKRMDYGVFEGSLSVTQAHLMGFEGIGDSLVSIWTSHQGICSGMPGGEIYNLTDPHYRIAETTAQGAAMIRLVEGSNQYVVSLT